MTLTVTQRMAGFKDCRTWHHWHVQCALVWLDVSRHADMIPIRYWEPHMVCAGCNKSRFKPSKRDSRPLWSRVKSWFTR